MCLIDIKDLIHVGGLAQDLFVEYYEELPCFEGYLIEIRHTNLELSSLVIDHVLLCDFDLLCRNPILFVDGDLVILEKKLLTLWKL
jgi:hypothetical protein